MSRPSVSGIRPHRYAILELHSEGKKIQQISTQLGVNCASVHRVLRQAGWSGRNWPCLRARLMARTGVLDVRTATVIRRFRFWDTLLGPRQALRGTLHEQVWIPEGHTSPRRLVLPWGCCG